MLGVLGEAILSAENGGENLWALGAPPRTRAGGAHSAPDPLAGAEGSAAPPQELLSPPLLSAFGLDFRPFGLAPDEKSWERH